MPADALRRRSVVAGLLTLLAGLAVGGRASAATTAAAAVKKKGISAWKYTGVTKDLADSEVGWFYTWSSGRQQITAPVGVEFVPMIWGPASATDAELNTARQQGTTLLGFNEPDMPGQANMTVQQALDLWPRLQSTGLRLGAPAVASGANTAGSWLDLFMKGAAARGYRVNFIPLHWYGGDFNTTNAVSQFRTYVQSVHQRYNKPIWITEYGLIDFSSGSPRYATQAQQAAFIKQSTNLLQSLSYVERYAWFTLSTSRGDGTGLYSGTTATQAGVAYRAAG
jgi:hypothetical protein